MANINPLNSIFKSKNGYFYTLEDLTRCINNQGYLYDYKYTQENLTQPPMPFTAEEMNQLMSNEILATSFREYAENNLGKILPKIFVIKGNTLALMQNLLEVFRDGAKKHGGLNWFLLDKEFGQVVLVPLHNLYSHLKNYPDEADALSFISDQLQSKSVLNFNVISYLGNIAQGNCASGFPQDLSTVLSIILSIDLYTFQEEKRIRDNNEITATAFFDKKPMTNYQSIKVRGTAYAPQVEDLIKKLIDYFDQKHALNRQDVTSISVENGKLLIETKSDRNFKVHLRDNIVKEALGVDIDNVDGHYKFYIRDISQLQEKLSNISLETHNQTSIFRNIN